MSDTQTSHEPRPGEPDRTPDHALAGHPAAGHDTDEHDAAPLGPIDVRVWGALVVGVAAGLLIVLCLVLAPSVIGSAAA